MPNIFSFQVEIAANRLKFRLYSIKYVMRAGPQLGVNLNPSWRKRQPYGSTMTIQVWSRHSPFKVVADAFILTTTLSLFTFAKYLTTTLYNAFLSIVISVGTEVFECKKYVMRVGPQLRNVYLTRWPVRSKRLPFFSM